MILRISCEQETKTKEKKNVLTLHVCSNYFSSRCYTNSVNKHKIYMHIQTTTKYKFEGYEILIFINVQLFNISTVIYGKYFVSTIRLSLVRQSL